MQKCSKDLLRQKKARGVLGSRKYRVSSVVGGLLVVFVAWSPDPRTSSGSLKSDHRKQLQRLVLCKTHTMSNKLYVGNLSFDATEIDIQDLFAQAGTVQEAALMQDKFTGKS
ncbi:MAG: hypothetical protein V4710_06530, partial [Verrucomicrobiota bacterium]